MAKYLVTGASGFLARILTRQLADAGHELVLVDLLDIADLPEGAKFLKVDLADRASVQLVSKLGTFDAIFHLASQIDFGVRSQQELMTNNVESTKSVAKIARQSGCTNVVFTSSNSIYLGYPGSRPITESDAPLPTDAYGRSKVACELVLREYEDDFNSLVFRCPNILDSGRVGMLSIFFDFVLESRKCWLIGDGNVRYQCVFAPDVVDAMMRSLSLGRSDTFNIGSDDVPSIREMYQAVIDHAGTHARVARLPRYPTVPVLRALKRVHLSPMGPYQFRMMTADFMFDCAHVKDSLGWRPTTNNSEMLIKAFDHYVANRDSLSELSDSANSSAVAQGILGIVRRLS